MLRTIVKRWATHSRQMPIRFYNENRIRRDLGMKENLLLMGSPGSGKTTIGHLLSERLGMSHVDVDNHHLEKHWGVPVADKLASIGAEAFVAAEGEALQHIDVQDTVISLSGSNPMHKEGFHHIQKTGPTIFLDVAHDDIIERLDRMKVNRIVGQTEGTSMLDILQYRQQFYEGNYDIRILCEQYESPGSIIQKIIQALYRYYKKPGYISTRGEQLQNFTFSDVVLQGLAPDGGLFCSAEGIPKLSCGEWLRLLPLSYAQRALRILEKWIPPSDIPPAVLHNMLSDAYNIETFNCHDTFPVIPLGNDIFITELFHGPTASFKDAALQLTPKFFQHAQKQTKSKHRYLILVATSGDTGGAVLDGFGRLPEDAGVDVMVIYPEHGISAIQKAQMTSLGGENVKVMGVRSDFDFCQSTIKMLFRDKQFCNKVQDKYGVLLSAANSINWGRLLPQVVYHASGYLDLVKRGVISMGDPIDLCIPTGNFGNILAAFYAREMGIPFSRLVCASNSNNVLTDFFNTGQYDLRSRPILQTTSPAIDILKSSNLERYLFHVLDKNSLTVRNLYHKLESDQHFTVPEEVVDQMHGVFEADWCDVEQCLATIKSYFAKTGYLMDPHTAVAVTVAERFTDKDTPMLVASTAHYAKFAPEVLHALGIQNPTSCISTALNQINELKPTPQMHVSLGKTLSQPRLHHHVCDARHDVIVDEVESFIQQRSG